MDQMIICKFGILILGFSFTLLASAVQVQVSAQEQPQFSPSSPPPPPPPSPPPPPPPPPPVSPPPPPPLVLSAPPPPPTPRIPPPPPPPQSPPPPPLSPHRTRNLPRHIPGGFNPNTGRKGRSMKHELNSGKKIGLLFIIVAGVLQIFVVGILIFQRRQMLKVKDRYENVE